MLSSSLQWVPRFYPEQRDIAREINNDKVTPPKVVTPLKNGV